MKNLKKLSALLLAFALLAGFIAPVAVYADDTVTLKIEGVAGHTYEAYQIFKGTKKEDSGELGNLEWGTGLVDAEASFGKVDEVLKTLKTADDAKAWSKKFGEKLSTVKYDLVGPSFSTTVPTGYYLIREANVPAGQVGTSYVVAVARDTNIKPKTKKPDFSKKIMDVNDSTDAPLTDADTLNPVDPKWQDSADYDIGDTVPFKLTAQVAADADDYKAPYKLVFKDQLSPELTPILDAQGKLAVVVKVNDAEVTSGYVVDETVIDGAKAFTITINDIKDIGAKGGDLVHVFLSATLNENAKIGATTDNLNKAKLEYSNNPTDEQGGTTETEWDTVRVFTYKYIVNKVDQDGKALPKAGFTLYKIMNDGTKKEIKKYEPSDKTTFDFVGLDDGKYILEESATPDGYNTIEPIEFTITAEHPWTSDDPALGTVTFTKKDGKAVEGTTGNGQITVEIENKIGVVLPETGGMGTTILYVLGSLLAIGAAVVLVTRKVVSNK